MDKSRCRISSFTYGTVIYLLLGLFALDNRGLGFGGGRTTIFHNHGFNLIGAELVQGRAGWRSDAASAFRSALKAQVRADALVDVLIAAGEGADLVEAAKDGSSAAQSAGLNETNIAAEESELANLIGIVLVGGQQESFVLGGHGEAGGVANAEAVFFGAATHFNVVAINGFVGTAHSTGHAVARAGFVFVGHGERVVKR